MNNETNCNGYDSLIGFGNQTFGHPWGVWPAVGSGGGGNPLVITKAYGWIMVR